MSDFLLELLSEEIPARMQEKARSDLARLFEGELAKAGLKAGAVETFSTPRRLALIARDLPEQTEAVSEELKGPRTSAPPQALEGFLRKTGLGQDQLTDRDGVWFAVIDKPGRATAEVLTEAIPAIVRAFPWPKSMRWGDASLSTESLRWVRPLQGIVALLGQDVVPCEIDGIASGAETVGHRFHHPGRITIGSAADYAAKLRACHVIVDQAERESIIATAATNATAAAGLTLVRDEALLKENAGLTEWPVPLLGSFDPAFLEVPPEVIQLTMATNQKYFAVQDRHGKLAPNFVCTANIEAHDGGAAIVAGNQKVLAARLSDAKFFWEQDLKISLEDQAQKLGQIVFHEKLGTVADKVDRVAKLARWLVEEGIVTNPSPLEGEGDSPQASGVRGESQLAQPVPSPSHSPDGERAPPSPSRGEGLSLADMAEQAARLAKADLVTGMVGEFPELQGVMGGYYARAQGLPDAVADAIRDHYKPVGQGDDVPTAPVTVAVSLADKLDSFFAFFMAGEVPTGSKDPFALRRSALAVLSLIEANNLRIRLISVLTAFYQSWVERWASEGSYVALVKGWEEAEPDGGGPYSYLDEKPASLDNLGSDQDFPELWLIDLYGRDLIAHKGSGPREDARWELNDRNLRDVTIYKFVRLSAFIQSAMAFFADRLKVQQREAGVRHDLIDAVFALGGEDDLVRLLARVRALQSFVETPEGRDLLAGYKRAANILKKENWAVTPAKAGVQESSVEGLDSGLRRNDGEGGSSGGAKDSFTPSEDFSLSYAPVSEEQALIAALDSAEPRARAAVAGEDFEGAMAALASLRGPVDAFFEKVTVNDADPAKREARLNLLARMRDAVHQVADFSRIEG